MSFQFVKIAPNIAIPRQATSYSAGYDLYAAVSAIIPANGRQIAVPTGVRLLFDDAIKHNYHARIYPRSGLAINHSIAVGAGLIDSDYEGEIKVVLYTTNSTEYSITAGERIAQIVIEPHITNAQPPIVETSKHEGFGSTGRT